MDDSPQMHHFLVPTIMGFMMGVFLGIIMSWDAENRRTILTTWAIGGTFAGWLLSGWFIRMRERWFFYEYSTSSAAPITAAPKETVILLYTEPNAYTRIRLGLDDEQWRVLARAVVAQNKFTITALQNVYGNQEGRQLYDQTVEHLKDAKILTPAGNGVVITDMGKRFFARMAEEPHHSPPEVGDMQSV